MYNLVRHTIFRKPCKSRTNFHLDSFTEDVYCLCQTPERPGMIGCDFCEEWFHPDCLGFSRKKVLEATQSHCWACPNCELDDSEGIYDFSLRSLSQKTSFCKKNQGKCKSLFSHVTISRIPLPFGQ